MDTPNQTEVVQEQPTPASQPPAAPSPFFGNQEMLDDNAVRQAIAKAEEEGRDPDALTLSDLSQGQASKPEVSQAPAPAQARPDVPEKFLKPDGEVDVEKLKTSTRQLDEAIQKKEIDLEKAIEQAAAEYREKERKFRELPNPARVAPVEPQAQTPAAPQVPMGDEFRRRIAEDLQRDFIGTISDLVDVVVEKRIEPITEERRDQKVRGNLKQIAQDDPRVVQFLSEVNKELDSDPAYFRLKNPHKAAWNEVKDRLRLGEYQRDAQAQPSRGPAPVLGGGSPPPTPSSAAPLNPRTLEAAINQVDMKNASQVDAFEKALRQMVQGNR